MTTTYRGEPTTCETLNDEELFDIVSQVRGMHRPTRGAFAACLWEMSNHINYQAAKHLFQLCGYVPFSGYPLKRSR